MDTEQFLTHVLPLRGPYVLAHDTNFFSKETQQPVSTYKQYAAPDIRRAVAIAQLLEREGRNVFFAVGACKKIQIWNATKQRFTISRRGDNIRGLRSYIMDIDAGMKDGKPRQYPTIEDAIAALKAFVKVTGLPRPTIVCSGLGLHVYWTLTEEVPEAEWEAHGKALSELALLHKFSIDHTRTIDSSSVLRVVGTTNKKYPDKPLVRCIYIGTPTKSEEMHMLIHQKTPLNPYIPPLTTQPLRDANGTPVIDFGKNIQVYQRGTLGIKELVANCQLMRYIATKENQQQGHVAISEPMWQGGMMLASHCKDGLKVAHFISRHDPRYKKEYIDSRYDRLLREDVGPAICANWEADFAKHGIPNACDGCPSKGKITSPAVVGKYVENAPPLIIPLQMAAGGIARTIPDPPDPYVRTTNGIAIKLDNPKTGAPQAITFCDYDMYPKRLRYDESTGLEDDVLWAVNLPGEGWTDVSVPHMQKAQIQATLAKRGIYVNEYNIQHQANFMTAYMRKLQSVVPREVAYSKCGWNRKFDSFVLGGTLYKKDGTHEEHAVSHSLEGATQGGITTAGDINVWRQLISIYGRFGNENYRANLYMAFGSIFYCFSGQIATCVSASGVTGTGKSTLLEACASIWGDPARLKVRGSKDGSTRAAAEVLANGMHHLPVFMDEITGRDAKDVADLIFNYSGGKGKIRSTAQGGIRNDTATWSNILLVNANSDEYERMSSVFRDSSQHMMRLIQFEFTPNETITKMEGDVIKRGVHEHYGWAGHLFVEYCVQHLDLIKKRVLHVIDEIDKETGAKPEERFWTAALACAQVGAEVAFSLGLLPGFPLAHDFKWMRAQITTLRARTLLQLPNADELISEFLDLNLGGTLTIGAKGASNIDNVLTEPNREIVIRYEVDNNLAYVSRNVFRQYCVDHGLNFNRALTDMLKKKVVTHDNILKSLGMGTKYGKGKVRCMQIDVKALGGNPNMVAATAMVGAAKAAVGIP